MNNGEVSSTVRKKNRSSPELAARPPRTVVRVHQKSVPTRSNVRSEADSPSGDSFVAATRSRAPRGRTTRSDERPSASRTATREMNCPTPAPQPRGRRRAPRAPLTGRARASGAERFAGSKWGAAPAAAALPPPPTHWRRDGRCRPGEPDRALPLKLLLNVSVA